MHRNTACYNTYYSTITIVLWSTSKPSLQDYSLVENRKGKTIGRRKTLNLQPKTERKGKGQYDKCHDGQQ